MVSAPGAGSAVSSAAAAGNAAMTAMLAAERRNKSRCFIARNASAAALTPERAFIGNVRGVVRAMDVRVAVQASARERVGSRAGERGVPDGAAMARRLVALLAQERRAGLQQVRGRRAVRVVTDRAVLLYRLVRAHERPALLHVARVTGVVHVIAHHHARARRAVRVVAVGARHEAFAYGVARGAIDLDPLLLVALEAGLRLRDLVARGVVRVQRVAGGARDVARGVGAGAPVDALAALVTGEADPVLD